MRYIPFVQYRECAVRILDAETEHTRIKVIAIVDDRTTDLSLESVRCAVAEFSPVVGCYIAFALVRSVITEGDGRITCQRIVLYTIVRSDTYYHGAVARIALGVTARTSTALVGVKYGDVEIVVLATVPSPVDVVEAVVVRTVTNESVSCCLRVSHVVYRTACSQFCVYEVSPLLESEGIARHHLYEVRVIAESDEVVWCRVCSRLGVIVHSHDASAAQH